MHELSIAQSLVELACEHARREGAARVAAIRVRLGVLSGLQKPLAFCFSAVARDTPCAGARLEIDEIALTLACPTCRKPQHPSGPYSFRCAVCGSPAPRVVTGREMQLVSLELEGGAAKPTKRPRPKGEVR